MSSRVCFTRSGYCTEDTVRLSKSLPLCGFCELESPAGTATEHGEARTHVKDEYIKLQHLDKESARLVDDWKRHAHEGSQSRSRSMALRRQYVRPSKSLPLYGFCELESPAGTATEHGEDGGDAREG